MVSTKKIKYYETKLNYLKNKAKKAIEEAYQDKNLDYISLISDGAGKLKSSTDIRDAIKYVSKYSCPAVIEISKLFEFTDEKEEAKIFNDKQSKTRISKLQDLNADFEKATDLIYLGTESQLLEMLQKMEKKYKVKIN